VSSGEEESKEQNAGSRCGCCHGHFQGGFFCSQVLHSYLMYVRWGWVAEGFYTGD
jgi:hypothetical protein